MIFFSHFVFSRQGMFLFFFFFSDDLNEKVKLNKPKAHKVRQIDLGGNRPRNFPDIALSSTTLCLDEASWTFNHTNAFLRILIPAPKVEPHMEIYYFQANTPFFPFFPQSFWQGPTTSFTFPRLWALHPHTAPLLTGNVEARTSPGWSYLSLTNTSPVGLTLCVPSLLSLFSKGLELFPKGLCICSGSSPYFPADLWVWGCRCLHSCSWSHRFLPTSHSSIRTDPVTKTQPICLWSTLHTRRQSRKQLKGDAEISWVKQKSFWWAALSDSLSPDITGAPAGDGAEWHRACLAPVHSPRFQWWVEGKTRGRRKVNIFNNG